MSVTDITPEKVLADLEETRRAALEAGAFAPAIRCSELQGRHIGMWRTDAPAGRSLEEMVMASYQPTEMSGNSSPVAPPK